MIVLIQAVLVDSVERKRIIRLLRASPHRHIILMRQRIAVAYLPVPVHILRPESRGVQALKPGEKHRLRIHLKTTVFHQQVGHHIGRHHPAGHRFIIGTHGVDQNLFVQHPELPVVQRSKLLHRIPDTQGISGLHLHLLTLSSRFRGDNNHTIRSSRPVDGRSRSILQHINAFDISRRDIQQRVQRIPFHKHRDPVYHIQRRIVGRQRSRNGIRRSHPAHIDRQRSPRFSAVLRHQYPLDGTSQHVLYGSRCMRKLFHVLLLHRNDRTGQTLPVLVAVADDHHILQQLGIRLQRHVLHLHRIIHRHLLRFQTYKGITHPARRVRKIQRILSVIIGNGTQRSPHHHYRHSRKRISRFITHHTRQDMTAVLILLEIRCIRVSRKNGIDPKGEHSDSHPKS